MKTLHEWMVFAVDQLDGKEIKSVNIYSETEELAVKEFNRIFPNNRFQIIRVHMARTEEELFQAIENTYKGYEAMYDDEPIVPNNREDDEDGIYI